MSTAGITVVIPVKDGARHLGELLEAVCAQRVGEPIEILVVDSGSRDGSSGHRARRGYDAARDLARAVRTRAHAQPGGRPGRRSLHRLPYPGRDSRQRNLARGAGSAAGCGRARGLSFGPHLRARNHAGGRARAGRVLRLVRARPRTAHRPRDRTFRPCQLVLLECQLLRPARVLGAAAVPGRRLRRGPGVRARRDRRRMGQGIRAAGAACCTRTTTPSGSSCAATSTSTGACARPPVTSSPSVAAPLLTTVVPEVRGDLGYMRRRGDAAPKVVLGGLRSARHHFGRALAAPLGSRADRLPRRHGAAPVAGGPRRRRCRAGLATRRASRQAALGLARHVDPGPPRARRSTARRSIAARRRQAADAPRLGDPAVPARQRRAHDDLHDHAWLEAMGHSCSIWIHDPQGDMDPREALAHREINPALHAAAGRRLHELRRLARRRRRARHRLADRIPGREARRLQVEGLLRAGLRAGLLSRLGRAAVGGGDIPARLSLHRRQSVAARRNARALRRALRGVRVGRRPGRLLRPRPGPRPGDRSVLLPPLNPAPRDRARPARPARGGPPVVPTRTW